MRRLRITLSPTTDIADLHKPFNLYQGTHNGVLIEMVVPMRLLYAQVVSPDRIDLANDVSCGAIIVNDEGKQITTRPYPFEFVKTFTKDGEDFAIYVIPEKRFPREFTRWAGAVTLVANVTNMALNDDAWVIDQVATTQTCQMEVLQSAFLPDDEPLEPSAQQILQGQINNNRESINDLDERVEYLEENTVTLAVLEEHNTDPDAHAEMQERLLEKANDYTDQEIARANLNKQKWLPAVAAYALLPPTIDPAWTWLCKVLRDPDPAKIGVWQAIPNGVDNTAEWTYFGDTADFVDDYELEQAINAHDTSPIAHADMRQDISNLKATSQQLVDGKLDKVQTTDPHYRAYVVQPNGSQGMLQVRPDPTPATIPSYGSNSTLKTKTPIVNDDATPKGYVDAANAEMKSALTDLGGQIAQVRQQADAIDIWRTTLVNPITYQVEDLQTILNSLVGLTATPITYFDLMELGLTYGEVQALDATYFEVIYRGQQIFTGGN